MIQTLLRNAFGVGAQYRYERTEYLWGEVHFHLSLKDEALICPLCGSVDEVIRKGRRYRSLQTVSIGLKRVYLVTEVARCRCQVCEMLFEVHPPLPVRRCAIRVSSKS
jgi:hypothetical protein